MGQEAVDVRLGEAFERYRYNAPGPVSLPRLVVGSVLVVLLWIATTMLVILPVMGWASTSFDELMTSNIGMFAMLLSFAGIWIGVWLALGLVHEDRLGNVLGASGRLSWRDFAKGVVAVVLTSLLSEVLIYAIRPEFTRSPLELSAWLLALAPMVLLCLLQTSAEEVLFRGYLMRGLANRFRSPWLWSVLPGLGFLLIHFTPGVTPRDMAMILLTIGALTVLLVMLVYVTGNLGASMGVHMGNNLVAFLFVGHQDGLAYYTLFRGAPIDDGTMTAGQTAALVLVGWVCVALTWWLLVARRSPLRVGVDGGQTWTSE